ncbi:MAG: TIGR02594 family protein, partial [Balneolales bacterium]|nr:TIGR02594 family protein [Balneolales bacterium]
SKALKLAFEELGVKEIPGEEHETRILQYAAESGIRGIDKDETAWCSIFTNWVSTKLGLPKSGSAAARSWVNVGDTTEHPKPGDIVVFWRESIHSWKGHVAFFLGFSEDLSKVYCLGGNQGNEVSVDAYDAAKVLRFQVIEGLAPSGIPEPTLRKGSKGDEVIKLQIALNKKGYNCGDPDGDFGNKTASALKNFQADNRLTVDGVYGNGPKAKLEVLMQE